MKISREEAKHLSSHILHELLNQFDSSKTLKNQQTVGQSSILAGEKKSQKIFVPHLLFTPIFSDSLCGSLSKMKVVLQAY